LATLDYGSLAQLAAAPLLPFILVVTGGPHHAEGGAFEWLTINAAAFLVWWAVIDVCLRFVFTRRLHSAAALAVPAAWYVVVAASMFFAPRFRAIDADPIPDQTDLQEVCRIDGKWLTPFGSGNHPIVGEGARLALLSDGRHNHWLLHSADCALQEVTLPSTTAPERIEPVTVTNDGEILFAVTVRDDRPLRYVGLDVSTGKTNGSWMPQREEGKTIFPSFSSDGLWAAWIADRSTENERVQGGPVDRLEARFEFDPAALLGRGSYDLLDVARGGRAILLEKYPS
jgi:hypothetical protein